MYIYIIILYLYSGVDLNQQTLNITGLMAPWAYYKYLR